VQNLYWKIYKKIPKKYLDFPSQIGYYQNFPLNEKKKQLFVLVIVNFVKMAKLINKSLKNNFASKIKATIRIKKQFC